MEKQTKKPGLQSLIKEAKKTEIQVQEIKSIVPQEIESSSDTPTLQEKNIERKENELSEKMTENEGINYFFETKKIKADEVVRITPEIHSQLKTLAALSGCTITTIVDNILCNVLEKNKNDILKFKKKHI
jgi:hypothetical protein